MNNILIVSLFGEINNVNSRVYKIAYAFSSKISFVTPDFSHGEKIYKKSCEIKSEKVFVQHLHVPSYSANLSLKRIYSHLVFAFRLRLYLQRLESKPDLIICLMPTSSAAYVCGQYSRKNGIMFVIDVIDLWPDSLIPLVKNNAIIKKLLMPWQALTNKAYRLATYISAESSAYALTAHVINPKVPWSYTYLGVNVAQTRKLIDRNTSDIKRPNNQIVLCYGGSLGNSYDFDSVVAAVKNIQEKGFNYKMFFVGDGEKREFIEEYSKRNNLNIEITGRVSYPDYLKYLSICDIGFNTFKQETKVVHSYKFNDYVACGLFIFNNLPGETADMIEKYNVGVNFTVQNLSEKLINVCQNWDKFKLYRNNLESLIKDELDSETIYKKLVDNILKAKVQ
ncbi:MAG: glycosyltransferase family 4 protein [Saprospiraceae bacterium]|nr:glycosyltransferase family 4 protein [Saprospiraceae bacterium]